MVDFMGFYHGVVYTMDRRFEEDELFGVQPLNITRWMKARLFGSDNIGGSNVDKTLLIRSSTLKVMKKAISWYMPNRLATWNQEN